MIGATNAAQPHRPRLRTGVRWYDDGEGLVVRSANGSFTMPAELRDLAVRLLPSLDGRRDLGELVAGYKTRDGLCAIALLSALAEHDLVVEGVGEAPSPPRRDGKEAWAGRSISVGGAGLLADAVRDRLTEVGARTAEADAPLSVLALDGPNMGALDTENRAAYDAGRAWMPVFPFGELVVVGPLIRPGDTACFRCFELRWLGISPSVALERQYLTSLREGRAYLEMQASDDARRLAERVAPLIATAACVPDAPTTVWLLSVDEDTTHQARLARHPLCEVCGPGGAGRGADLAGDGESWREAACDLPEVLHNIAGLVDRFVGIVADVPAPFRRDGDGSSGLPAVALSRYAAPQPALVTARQTNLAHGSGDTEETARAVALVEAIERFCGLFPPRADVIARFDDLGGTALLPTELPLFSTRQYERPGFPYVPFTPDLLLGWTWGWNVSRGQRILVPSAAVWYGAEDRLVGETSNGVAAHSGRGKALHNAVLELIERDAFMIHWLHRISPPLFDRGRLCGDVAALAGRVEAAGYRVILADISTDLGVPVVLALGVHELGDRPALLVGAGASLDGATAMRHALRELNAAAGGLSDAWQLGRPLPPDGVVELEDHSRAYEHPDWLPHASFLWAEEATKAPAADIAGRAEPGGGLDPLVAQLARRGYDVIGVDISTPEVERCGVRVVRAIVPGLQPLAFGQRIRLGGRRLYEAPMLMGRTRRVLSESELNPSPHCFP